MTLHLPEHVKWGTSRGRETYGYTTCVLYEHGQKKAACNGGGYDMFGTVFGEWLQNEHQEELLALAKRRGKVEVLDWTGDRYTRKKPVEGKRAEFYGATYYRRPRDPKVLPHVTLDGACGFESMRSIAKALGYSVRTIDAGRKRDVILLERNTP